MENGYPIVLDTGSSKPSIFDLSAQVRFYSAYHNNSTNKFIHFFGITTITWTILVWLAIPKPLVSNFVPGFPLNYNLILVAIYTLYYIILSPIPGITWCIFALGLTYASNEFVKLANGPLDTLTVCMIALGIHIAAWIAQFVGHGVFERRKPALLDSIAQAFIYAPLFIWIEFLFLCGWNQNLAQKVDRQAKEDIAHWKATQKTLNPKNSSSGYQT